MGYMIRETEVGASAWHNVMSGLRGPDLFGNSPEERKTQRVIKSCTSLLVRRAVYGVQLAGDFSMPSNPEAAEFLALPPAKMGPLVGWHFLDHARAALWALQNNDLTLPEDKALVASVLVQLELASRGV